MKIKLRCEEMGCPDAGVFHPVTLDVLGEWVSPRVYCRKHRKGRGHRFLDARTAVIQYGPDWRSRATETRP